MNQHIFFYYCLPFLKNLIVTLFSAFYIYYAIKKVVTFFSRTFTKTLTTSGIAIDTPKTTPDVTIETTTATATATTDDTSNANFDHQNNGDSSTTATKTNITQTEIDYGSLRHSINSIKSWIELAGTIKLLSLTSPLLPLQSERMLAKHVLTEFFTIDRFSRLRPLLYYIYDKNTKDEDSLSLATALATLMIKCLKIADTVKEDRKYPLQDVLPLLTNAIRASPDTFVCDFVLYSITDNATMTLVLDQDLNHDENSSSMINNNNNNNNRKQSGSDIIDQFMKNDFLTPLPKHTGSFYSRIYRRFIGSTLLEKDTQLMMFDRFAKKTFRDINHIQVQLWVKDLVSHINPPFSDNPSTSGVNPRSILVPAPSNTGTATKKNSAADTLIVANSDPLKFDDADCVKINGDDEALKEYNNRKNGPAYATFEDNIIELRRKYATIQSEIEDLISHKNIRLINQVYTLSKMGLTLPGVAKRILQLQKAFRALITHFKQYQDYILEYEKGFACYQMTNLVEFYINDAQSYYGFLSVKLKSSPQVDMKSVQHLKKLIDRAAFMAYNLKNNFLVFVAKDMDYKKNEYRDRINTIYDTCFIFNRQYIEEFQGKEFLNRIRREKKTADEKLKQDQNKETVMQQDSSSTVINNQTAPQQQNNSSE